VKFQSYADWLFDYRPLNITDTMWSESKNLNLCSMPCVCDKTWAFDFYHAVGAFYLQHGLYQTDAQVTNGLGNVTFPDLHSMGNANVTKKSTRVIRSDVPEGLSASDQNKFSARSSLQKGGIT
jgi:hypothetical protein